jgi:alpha-ribazole phosphatase
MQLYLIRHTTPDIESGICYGQTDIPLRETFKSEWDALKQSLPLQADVIYSSPLSRCFLLAELIRSHYSLPTIVKDSRLMEMNFGDWEMKNWNDIDQQLLMIWMNNYKVEKCPDGESYQDLLDRIKLFLESLSNSRAQSAIVVTHAGVIKLTDSILNPGNSIHPLEMRVAYGGIFRYEMSIK